MKTPLLLTLALVGIGCGSSTPQESAAPNDPLAKDDGGERGPDAPPPAGGPDAGDGGSLLPDGGVAGGKLVWSTDVTTNLDTTIAATDTHVAMVVTRGPLTVISADSATKTEVLSGARTARLVRGVGSKLVVAGTEGSGPDVRGMFTADVIGGTVTNEHVVPLPDSVHYGIAQIDALSNIGIVFGAQLVRYAPSGAEIGRAAFAPPTSGDWVAATAMSESGALAAVGHYQAIVNVLVPGRPPFSYTMPNLYAQALAFGADRLAIVTSSGIARSTLHVVSLTGALLEAAPIEGMTVHAIAFANDREIVVTGETLGVVNARQARVRRLDLSKKVVVWTYDEPEVPSGVTMGVAIALAPSGAVYAAMTRDAVSGVGKIVRLTP